VTPQATDVLSALIGAATAAGAQARGPVPLPPPTIYSAPTPAPLARRPIPVRPSRRLTAITAANATEKTTKIAYRLRECLLICR